MNPHRAIGQLQADNPCANTAKHTTLVSCLTSNILLSLRYTYFFFYPPLTSPYSPSPIFSLSYQVRQEIASNEQPIAVWPLTDSSSSPTAIFPLARAGPPATISSTTTGVELSVLGTLQQQGGKSYNGFQVEPFSFDLIVCVFSYQSLIQHKQPTTGLDSFPESLSPSDSHSVTCTD